MIASIQGIGILNHTTRHFEYRNKDRYKRPYNYFVTRWQVARVCEKAACLIIQCQYQGKKGILSGSKKENIQTIHWNPCGKHELVIMMWKPPFLGGKHVQLLLDLET